MKSKKYSLPVIASALALVFTGTTGAQADDASVDPISTVEDLAAESLDPSVVATPSPDPSVAAISKTDEVTVEFPAEPGEAIVLSEDSGTSLTVTLPEPESESAPEVRSGAVSYDNGNGSHTVTSLDADGAFTALTVIESSRAPSFYSYEFGGSHGTWLDKQEDGSVLIRDADGNITGFVDIPWAKDATGAPVPTHYEISGMTLTQRIDLSSRSVQYPVVADPQIYSEWWGHVIKLTKAETKRAQGKTGFASILAAVCGYIPVTHIRIACIGLVGVKATQLVNTTRQAAGQKRCLAINIPAGYWAGIGGSFLGVNFSNVKCTK